MTSTDRLEWLKKFEKRLETRIAVREGRSRGLSRYRLAIAIVGTAAVVATDEWVGRDAAWIAGIAAATIFSFVAIFHSRVIRSLKKHQIYRSIKLQNAARIRRDWKDIPREHGTDAGPEHPFAADLTLTGPRSLHHLLDTSFTNEGSERLKDWLLSVHPDVPAAISRQHLVRELAARPAFRDRLVLISTLVSGDSSGRWKGDLLVQWLQRADDRKAMVRVLWLLFPLALATPVLLVLGSIFSIGSWWALSLMAYVSIYLLSSRLYGHLFEEAEQLYSELSRFRPVLSFLENYRCGSAAAMQSVLHPFQASGRRPSAYLRTVMWLSVAASAQKNDVFRLVLNLLMPWELFFSLRLSLYKERLRDRLPGWLDAIQTLEAASSLGAYADLNPESTFPELIEEATGEPFVRAEAIGHPLLQESVKVRNDVSISGAGTLFIITGSNMSGKSTFLRTIGINLALANAGGPVDATFMTAPALRMFTCMNVSDSVNDGISLFYAEVKRLSKLMEQATQTDAPPMLFLVDEIFRGTNNRERLLGSRAILRALTRGPALGLVSTHDLDLTDLAAESDRIRNFHFREHVDKGRMIFDYLVRSGPCPTTNALKIMEMAGLPVDRITESGS